MVIMYMYYVLYTADAYCIVYRFFYMHFVSFFFRILIGYTLYLTYIDTVVS